MEPKLKAEELIKKFEPFVYPYLGSGMLTNTTNDKVILMSAKQCAIIAVDEILSASTIKMSEHDSNKFVYIDDYWQQVKTELEKM